VPLYTFKNETRFKKRMIFNYQENNHRKFYESIVLLPPKAVPTGGARYFGEQEDKKNN